jgi:hypothetical protein
MSVENELARLMRSRFRGSIRLDAPDRAYLSQHGLRRVMDEAAVFVLRRLAPPVPRNDGRQTPWHGHPAFVAQHATATCCRRCLEKWHGVQRGRALGAEETTHVLALIEAWLRARGVPATDPPTQPLLFEETSEESH